jgi:REP element-mobilizing transposase RayT
VRPESVIFNINSDGMANTYKKVYLHLVFAVKNRRALLHISWRRKVFGYLFEAINSRGNFAYIVGGYNDHVHLFFDYKGKELIEDLVREIKKSSNHFINENNFSPYKFEWQVGYGLFSEGYRTKSMIINYILNQDIHHNKKNTFKSEYIKMLEDYEIEFKDEYVFDFWDEPDDMI